MKTPFRYFRDPVFLAALALYLLNRGLLKPLFAEYTHFFMNYTNDLICIPFCLPLCLFVYRRVGVRTHDGFPTKSEIMIHLIVWALFFEWIGPTWKGIFTLSVADGWDVIAYAVGAVVAGGYWGTWKGIHFSAFALRRSRRVPNVK